MIKGGHVFEWKGNIRPSSPVSFHDQFRFTVWVSPNFWRTPRVANSFSTHWTTPAWLPERLGNLCQSDVGPRRRSEPILGTSVRNDLGEGCWVGEVPNVPLGVGFNEWDVPWDEWDCMGSIQVFKCRKLSVGKSKGCFAKIEYWFCSNMFCAICLRNTHPSNNPRKRLQLVTSTAATFTIIPLWIGSTVVMWCDGWRLSNFSSTFGNCSGQSCL